MSLRDELLQCVTGDVEHRRPENCLIRACAYRILDFLSELSRKSLEGD